ncbi:MULTISPECIES: dihydrofolate reductase family protein [Curtobacterium]|uniref:dihydrofolate reductase family protein n=1 Tax=Curtobacterium TaxID=2034 RepID=UPI0018E4DC9D|nr:MULTISPECIES: dihydrofolate reductase family protein [Curtobacterium]MCA5922640.1 dihydrofolate reductase family protein [Curtobacterium oceanosedimentum]QQD75632.1 dihydrofolate reductase family protein [Curtobacterium sp. YC1]
MRKTTAGLFTSVDGVVQDPYEFQYDSFDDELGAAMGAWMARTDTVLLGRTSYLEWSEWWPAHADDPFGQWINPIEKHVASTTLGDDLAWQNSTRIRGDVPTFVRELQQRDGADIAVCGSVTLVRSLLFAGVLDELQLMIHPAIAGSGRRLFEPTDPATRLRLVDSTVTSRGNVLNTYGRFAD